MLSAVALFGAVACSEAQPPRGVNVIPMPNEVEAKEGVFDVAGAPVSYDAKKCDARMTAQLEEFAKRLSLVTGVESKLYDKTKCSGFSFVMDPEIPAEAYELEVKPRSVKVKAGDFNGMLYALQTIKQLLPAEYFVAAAAPEADWTIGCVSIKDQPRFGYRGVHLDVVRHFFSIDEVKKYINAIALHKGNRFHWHLTDDQGWRVEIKKYPKLTEIGAWRDGTVIQKDWDSNDGIRHGGFYTQDEIREVVEYADNLGITVIPEIDLPGHMLAALAAYPELGCTGGPYEVWKRWGISPQVLCPGKEDMFVFLEDVLSEVMELFPSEYIHIGGDECPKTEWEKCPACQKRIAELGFKDDENYTAEQRLQNYVTGRVQKFVESKGRKIIGWDEILIDDLAEGTTIMSWRGTKGGIAAAKRGFDVIMTPYTYMYLDYYQSTERDKEPFAIGGHLPVEKVYSFDPYEELDDEAKKHILGVQANLWTEYVGTDEHLEYMLLPRLDALSEVQWCDEDNRDYERFKKSIVKMMAVYDALGYTYSRNIFGEPGM